MLKSLLTVLILFGFVFSVPVCAQETESSNRKAGFDTGFGFQDGLNVDYHYEVILVRVQYFHPLWEGDYLQLHLVTEPQFNLTEVEAKENDENLNTEKGFETGVNFSFTVGKHIFNRSAYLFIAAGVGPHYASVTPDRQKSGFIFSDNFYTGLNFPVTSKLAVSPKIGFRHISNAGLYRPNGGVNNFFVSSGLLWLF